MTSAQQVINQLQVAYEAFVNAEQLEVGALLRGAEDKGAAAKVLQFLTNIGVRTQTAEPRLLMDEMRF